MFVESDVYRYVTIALMIFALVSHQAGVRWISRDWLALLCYAWAVYAASRFAFGVFVLGERGASEWLYIFPVFFPLMGVALYKTRRYVFSAATLLVGCGLVGLILTLDFPALLSGQRAAPFYHHNSIHAGIGSCMLFLSAVFWLFHAAETGRLRGGMSWLFLPIGIATAALSLVGALGSHSKGAWLALVATIAFMGVLSFFHYAGRWRLHLLGGLLFAAAAATMIAAPFVEKVARPTMDAATKLTGDTIAIEGPLAAMEKAIVDPATPSSMRERLELWSNAIELVQAAPWVGWGNEWLRKWYGTTYADVGYTLIHNGYLEIMVRHGLLGIIFLFVFAVAAARRTNDAHRRGVISSSLAAYIYSLSFFFFCTIATNSNNRLALGESFFILMAAAVFSFTLARRKAEQELI
ncbi:O-antigen ligase family protein [Shinella zoogloeoides]|uniref:O-antigen ligase domain-containing protein n=1 Tax=Shinella zoogloeoides TaxID=352475 RepID=A0A6N8TP66_SHIZO|nr:O-antigen ligase family protein [Shinella zoogloeoides]MXO03038.1 O-antigen ligase domain-containing protein [Shinella zoogloeoides]UEX80984.1 O-antigen ligase family protein [Shinella zoogloeoides]